MSYGFNDPNHPHYVPDRPVHPEDMPGFEDEPDESPLGRELTNEEIDRMTAITRHAIQRDAEFHRRIELEKRISDEADRIAEDVL